MTVTSLALPEVLLIEPRIFSDPRGYFLETYSTRSFPAQTPSVTFVQDNLSFSSRGTLRGLHLQHPNDQGKLVMAVTGRIFDVAVDVRRGSPTFGQWVGAELGDEKRAQLYIPPGFAHGFCVLSETAHVHYKCTDLYTPGSEQGIRFDDPDIGIEWPVDAPLLSEKDEAAPLLKDVPEGKLPVFTSGKSS